MVLRSGSNSASLIGLVLGIFLIASQALAQLPLLPESSRPIPSPREASWKPSNRFNVELPLHDAVDTLATELRHQFEAAARVARPASCADDGATAYALSLLIAGELDRCSLYARACAAEASLRTPEPILIGALCEAQRFEYAAADQHFAAATAPRFATSPDFDHALIEYAAFAMYGIHEELVPEIIAREPAWSPTTRKLWEAVIKRAARIDLGEFTKTQVDQFLSNELAHASGPLAELLKSLSIRIAFLDFHYAEAAASLTKHAPELRNPMLWYDLAYLVYYHSLDTDFVQARKFYDAFDGFANRWWTLPLEQNTLTYTEIYAKACSSALLQGADFDRLSALKERIRRGQLAPPEALTEVKSLVRAFPDKADVLTTYGGVLALNDRHQEAFDVYWSAHRACRYYNRANWGLALEKRWLKYSHMPDYAAGQVRVDRTVSALVVPPELASYVVNWGALSSEAQRRVEYGARIWLPYIKTLSENHLSTYIKFAFDLLSDSPGLMEVRDQRIGGPNYPNDNRLWDDVRGLGGETVIADLSEVFQTVQGDYNLLGHEMTHQFQTLLELRAPPTLDCVVKLYAEAKTAGNFPDAYSSYNKEEHFAQGVTYYLVPPDSPKRFGLNESWLERNNLHQLSFIRSIEVSQGDLTRIGCPL